MTLRERLNAITDEEWAALRRSSIEDARARSWYQREWWHLKFYARSDENDRFSKQFDRVHDCWEIPAERAIFYPSDGRFALGQTPVTYLAVGPDVGEVEKHFEDFKGRGFEAVEQWARGERTPAPDDFGYPLNFRLEENAVVLDLSFTNTRLFHLVDGDQAGLFRDTIESTDESVYKDTQMIAQSVHANGYDGIIWESVRFPKDGNIDHMNMVVFSRETIRPWEPPN